MHWRTYWRLYEEARNVSPGFQRLPSELYPRFNWLIPELRPCEDASETILDGLHPITDLLVAYLYLDPKKPEIRVLGRDTSSRTNQETDLFCDPLYAQVLLDLTKSRGLTRVTHNDVLDLLDKRIEKPIPYLPKLSSRALLIEFRDLKRTLGKAYAAKLAGYKLKIEYAFVYGASVNPQKREITLGAPLIRNTLINSILGQESHVRMLVESLDGEIHTVSSATVDAVVDLVGGTFLRLKAQMAFVIAHELAHVYLGKKEPLELNESLCDCFAATHLYVTHGEAGLGAFKFVSEAVDGSKLDDIGLRSADPIAIAARTKSVNEVIDLLRSGENPDAVLAMCRAMT